MNENRIGIIIADKNEIHDIESFIHIKTHKNNYFVVEEYEFKNNLIYVINSGIGITNSAISTQFLIDKFNVSSIWNYGAVGGSNKMNLYQLVIPKKFYYHDVVTPWYKRGQTPQENEYYLNSFSKTDNINIASGQSFVFDLKYIDEIKNELDVDLFDMEATSIAQVCNKNNIPFYSIKCVSDLIGVSKTNNFNINQSIKKASKKALDALIQKMIIFMNK